MPHIFANTNSVIQSPNGAPFDFIVHSDHDSLIGVIGEDKEFFLTQRVKGDRLLVKYDKLTRLSNLSLIKTTIKDFMKIHNLEASSSNLEDKSIEKSHEFLKDIRYFVNKKFDKELIVEIGFGSGTHLLHKANQNKDKIVIGLEIHKPSIEQVLRQIKLQDLSNLYVVDYDARLFLELLESNSVSNIYVHFPVPWDKKPHRRVYSETFIEEASRVLKVSGTLELRTDSDNYYEYVKGLFEQKPELEVQITKNQPLEVTSKYEARWRRQNKNIYDIVFTNTLESEHSNETFDFSFDSVNLFSLNNFEKKPIVEEDVLVHFESLYTSLNVAVIKVAFGSFNRPEHKYILIKDNSARYFQSEPIPTTSNYKAHKIIKKVLCG